MAAPVAQPPARLAPSALDRAVAAGMIPWREDATTWRILSASTPGLARTVAVDGATAVSCDCPARCYCKHLAAVQHYLDRRLWPHIRRCAECGTEPVNRRGETCPGCAKNRAPEIPEQGRCRHGRHINEWCQPCGDEARAEVAKIRSLDPSVLRPALSDLDDNEDGQYGEEERRRYADLDIPAIPESTPTAVPGASYAPRECGLEEDPPRCRHCGRHLVAHFGRLCPPPDVPESTVEEIRETYALLAETTASLIAQAPAPLAFRSREELVAGGARFEGEGTRLLIANDPLA